MSIKMNNVPLRFNIFINHIQLEVDMATQATKHHCTKAVISILVELGSKATT